MDLEIIRFDELPSTSTYLAERAVSLSSGTMIVADAQTAGRGQRGNSWESEPGKNLTFTILFRPENFPARRQFRLSQAVALAVVDVLRKECGVQCLVKWPNDIYAGDRKIAGILISHSLESSPDGGPSIRHSLIGIGININQTEFLSDAPNPVSVRQITGEDNELPPLLKKIGETILDYLHTATEIENNERLHSRFMEHLWRGDAQYYPFRDTASGAVFEATVSCIEPMGHIVLRDTDGNLHRYAFKEVEWIL